MDEETVAPIEAAGVLFRAGDRVLLVRRVSADKHHGLWEFPGGHVEAGESHAQAAARESLEEVGYLPDADGLRPFAVKLADGVQFTTFLVHVPYEFSPALNAEHNEFQWAPLYNLPTDLHPGAAEDLALLTAPVVTELDIAMQMRDGTLGPVQKFQNVWLFDLRITGTGTAYRRERDEYVYRAPENYLSEYFLARCNGLSVIWNHPDPEKDGTGKLNHEQFIKRIIGSIFLPYIKGSEVWGIARVYDENAAQEMQRVQLSTSPMVMFPNPEVNANIPLNGGSSLLIEGKAALLDHLAVCAQGVWDKGGDPTGINSNIIEAPNMVDKVQTGEEQQGAAPVTDPAVVAMFQKISERLDSQDALLANLAPRQERADSVETDEEKAAREAQEKADAAKNCEETPEAKAAREAKEKADAEEMAQMRADAAAYRELAPRLATIEKNLPKLTSDADYADMHTAQARADSVYNAFGQRAPAPLMGESLLAYRKRLVAPHKTHSKTYSNVDLAQINDSALLDVVEGAIYADAMNAAENPVAIEGGLREVHKIIGGRQVTEFIGSPRAWMAPFMTQSQKVNGFNRNQEL